MMTVYREAMGDAPLLKDFIDREAVTAVADAVAGVADSVGADDIVAAVLDDSWDDRALKQRIRHVAVTVRSFLPADYLEALPIMRKAARDVESGWVGWVFNDFVEEYGVDHPDSSLPALEQFTKLASAEFAVRPFIQRYPERMAVQMLEWAANPDALVRRLATEGFRPRLPWGMGLPAVKQDPAPVIPVLELLRHDPSEDVRRSVANNLNDISKDHPELVVDLLGNWADDTPEMAALTKHALRTLLKQGHTGAMALLGFSATPEVRLAAVTIDPSVAPVGGHVHVEFAIESTAATPQLVMVDYAVTYQNASGTGSRKVFKGKVAELDRGESLVMKRKVSLQPMTTRRIFPGPHEVEIQVNGVVLGKAQFDVVE